MEDQVTEVKEKVEKLNLKNNMKEMFKPSRSRVETLEPTSDVSSSLLIGSGSGGLQPMRVEEISVPWDTPDPDYLVEPVKKPPHQR